MTTKSRENARRFAAATTALLLGLLAAPTALSSEEAQPAAGSAGEPVLATIAAMLNAKPAPAAVAATNSCEGGEDCGYCSASISCNESSNAVCSCTDTGNTCWSWFHKKAVYTCSCECVYVPDPEPPEQVCVGNPDPIFCVTTGSEGGLPLCEPVPMGTSSASIIPPACTLPQGSSGASREGTTVRLEVDAEDEVARR